MTGRDGSETSEVRSRDSIHVVDPLQVPWSVATPAPGKGDPPGEELTAFASPDGRFTFGLTRRQSLHREIVWAHHEVALILEGEVEITASDGSVVRASPGNVVVTPRGTSGVWRSLTPYRKVWAVYE
ncbi:hypothetical protein DSM104299_03588 [Baekduia alba]|uniref:cupin domain-containing protein n=1 Tax=Baekduia alba TaxID=2997333 RepID=UPI00234133CA|nr:cupin domain-containing protein [Baekduia alba]WCB94848.1 hypothetical protein DSM104299_03588 [Baekduia alba]